MEKNKGPFHSFRIVGEPDSIYKKVFIDGEELEHVRSVTVRYSPLEIPTVLLELNTLDLTIEEPDAEILITANDLSDLGVVTKWTRLK